MDNDKQDWSIFDSGPPQQMLHVFDQIALRYSNTQQAVETHRKAMHFFPPIASPFSKKALTARGFITLTIGTQPQAAWQREQPQFTEGMTCWRGLRKKQSNADLACRKLAVQNKELKMHAPWDHALLAVILCVDLLTHGVLSLVVTDQINWAQ